MIPFQKKKKINEIKEILQTKLIKILKWFYINKNDVINNKIQNKIIWIINKNKIK